MRYPNVSAEQLAQAESEAAGILVVPSDAKHVVKKDRNTGEESEHYYWRESAAVEAINVSEVVSKNGDEHDLYEVTFKVTATQRTGDNVGSTNAKISARFNPSAWEAKVKTDGQYKMSRGTLVLLAKLVRACGIPVQGGLSSAQLAALFPESGQSDLIGNEVLIDIHQGESEYAPSGWQCEVTQVFPLKRAEPDAEV